MVTEYVDGVTLRQHVSNRRLKLVEVMDVAIQIVAALNAAHEAGVTHRDLKPENVMVRRDHIVKVLDFGLAKPSAPSSDKQIDSEAGTKVLVHTEPGLVMGTVSYMSPEQSVGKGVDQRTDIWSFGVVLYEMIAGCVPFPGKDIHRQIIAIQEAEPAPLSQQVEGMPERLEEIVAKCLAKEKDERYQTAKDLLIDLRNLRRKLDVDAEIERTVAPALRGTGSGARGTQEAQVSTAVNSSAAGTHTTSSVEYLVTGIKRHKLAAVVVALALFTGIVGIGLYRRARSSNTEGAINSIAVLPFQNRSADADTEYLSDGLAESLIYRLSQLPNLKVSPTSAVMRYKGKELDAQRIAAELGVQSVMSGRMTQRGENLSISVELIDAANNKIEAYQLYLKGRFLWNKRTVESLKQAVEYYNQAVGNDPSFALAYSGLAETYVLFPNYDVASAKDSMPQAKAAALRALELDDSLAEAHTALGWYLFQFEYDWAGGEREFRRAIELNPKYATAHQWLGELLSQTKRFDEGQAETKLALEADPLSPIITFNVGWQLFLARRYDDALREFDRTATIYPDFPLATTGLCWSHDAKGALDDAIPTCRKALELVPDAFNRGYLSFVLGRAGQREEARKLLDELKNLSLRRDVPSIALAFAHMGLGQKEEAMAMLQKEVDERGYWASTFAVQPELDEFRSDPRFKELLRRMNLPQ